MNLTITVTTEGRAVIPHALVILREDTFGQPRGAKVFELELRTDETGKATAAVPCNYLDVFVTHDGFAPAAQKILVTTDANTFSVPLKTYAITRTTEVLVPGGVPTATAELPSVINEPKCEKDNLPQTVKVALNRFPDLRVSCRIKPSFIRGDFEGEGRDDYAVLVDEKQGRKRFFLIIFAGGRSVVAGAGTPVMYGASRNFDLNFDEWELHRKQEPIESGENQESLTLHVDALLVSYRESASGLFYWDGKSIHWYQQGD